MPKRLRMTMAVVVPQPTKAQPLANAMCGFRAIDKVAMPLLSPGA